MRDDDVRSACFAALDVLQATWGADVPYAALAEGFNFRGRRAPFLNRAYGIYRAADAQRGPAALSVNSSPKQIRYQDEQTPDGVLYRYQGNDPENHFNRWLRSAHLLDVPIVYFVGTRPAHEVSISARCVRHLEVRLDANDERGGTMKYLMLVCWGTDDMNALTEPDPNEPEDEESFPWLDDLQARGIWLTGDQLAPPRRARSVRVRDGKTMVTDGPFAETKEAVGGFDILECGSLEEAVEIAAGHPVAQTGTIEIRPLWGS